MRLRLRLGSRLHRTVGATLAFAALAGGPFCGARAQSMEPLSYTNAPIGLNFLIAGYTHQWGSVLVDPSIPVTNVTAKVDTPFLAFSRIMDFWGQSGSLALVVPYVRLSASGNVQEQARSVERTGMGDLAMRLSVNFYGAPALSLQQFSSYQQDWIIGGTLLVGAPTGQYYHEKLVNIGTNRWSFKPELGVSKALGPWTLESEASVTLFTDNDEFYGNNVRHQNPLFAVQGHAIYNFSPKVWGAVDATYYAGGSTTLNGRPDYDLQQNTRWGATLAYTLARQHSIKMYFSDGATTRSGTDFKVVGIAWQYRWGGGL
jgi:outer membrane putative beta-barrel porin/alpha-amylase